MNLFAFALIIPLCLAAPARASPQDGLSLARELQRRVGSRARLRVAPLPDLISRDGEWTKKRRRLASFTNQARGPGIIAICPQTLRALNRVARGSRREADVQNGVFVLLHEAAHSISFRRHRLWISDGEFAAEEAWADARAARELRAWKTKRWTSSSSPSSSPASRERDEQGAVKARPAPLPRGEDAAHFGGEFFDFNP